MAFRASFPASFFLASQRCSFAASRGGNDRLVRVHVGDGRDADAWRLDDVDGMDANYPDRRGPGPRRPFLGMWVVMMVAMMLPSLVPMLWRYPPCRWQDTRDAPRPADRARGRGLLLRLDRARNGRFFSAGRRAGRRSRWSNRRWARAVPIAVGVVVLIAGSLQLTAWKARHLACCREAPGRGRTLPAGAATAWRHGLRLGLHCSHCCAGLMVILLVIGVMEPSRDGCRGSSHHRRASRTGR